MGVSMRRMSQTNIELGSLIQQIWSFQCFIVILSINKQTHTHMATYPSKNERERERGREANKWIETLAKQPGSMNWNEEWHDYTKKWEWEWKWTQLNWIEQWTNESEKKWEKKNKIIFSPVEGKLNHLFRNVSFSISFLS